MKRSFLILAAIFIAPYLPSCGRRADTSNDHLRFDEGEAFRLLVEIVRIGPRHSGSDGALRTVEFIEGRLSKYGIPHFRDEWEEDTPAGRILFRNVIAQIGHPQKRPLLVLGTHYDTKRLELCPGFQGANDGASGVAILLECARALWDKREKLGKNIEIAFFDGEECVYAYSEGDGLHGSRRHLENLTRRREKIEAVIIADMLADRHLDAFIPPESDEKLSSLFLEAASDLGFSAHFTRKNMRMINDHSPFVEAGIPSLLVMDFNYGPGNVFWHSSGDNLDNVSSESLAISGRTICLFMSKLANFKFHASFLLRIFQLES